MNVEEREQGLLKLVEDYREQECRRILAEADRKAADLRRQAFERQRALLHQRVVAERSRAHALIQAAEAERATRDRRRGERRDAALTAVAWPLLTEALRQRWAGVESRSAWVALALAEAHRRLPPGGWLVRHPVGWPQSERDDAAERIREAGGEAELSADSSIDAGLIVVGRGAVLDMSLGGLLGDRARIEARILALAKGHERAQPRAGLRDGAR